MAEIMLRIFGSKLLTAPIDAEEEVHPRFGEFLSKNKVRFQKIVYQKTYD